MSCREKDNLSIYKNFKFQQFCRVVNHSLTIPLHTDRREVFC